MLLGRPDGSSVSMSDVARPRVWDAWRGWQTATQSGVSIDSSTAMGVPAFWSAVMLIARTAGSLPLLTMNDREVGDVVTAAGVARRLRRPNGEWTGVRFWTMWFANRAATGNAYAVKLPSSDGIDSPELWPVPSMTVYPWRDDSGVLWYRHALPDGGLIDLHHSHVVHAAGPSLSNRLRGDSPIEMHRATLGVYKSAQTYQERFFLNDARPRGILSVEESLEVEQARTLRDQWHSAYGGVENSHAIAVLDHGAKFQTVSISPEDAQFMEQMKFSAAQIAQVFNLPPALIGAEGSSVTYDTTLHNDSHFLKITLRPYLRETEAVLDADVDFFGESSAWHPRFSVDDVTQPDQSARFETHRVALESGFMTVNEVRRREGLPPLSGGDEITQSSAGTPTGGMGDGTPQS